MRPFEYANPQTEAEALELLNEHGAETAVLAGGTDLLNLLKRDLVQPKRVVDIKQVDSLRGLRAVEGGIEIGVLTTLEELNEHPLAADYRCLRDVVDGTHSVQVQSMGTVGGDLCHLPNCWYFRNGDGIFAMRDGRSLVEQGDNRYHAILGNTGPAKFVSASRFAPPLCASGAEVRIVGPGPDEETFLPLEYFYRTPKTPSQGPTVLRPGQLVTHVRVPYATGTRNATYEVLEIDGLDWPLAAASAMLRMHGSIVTDAAICLGHVAPTPWMAPGAAQSLVGKPVNEETAAVAGDIALAEATPLSENDYKVQVARAAVKRALLRAVDLLEGGL